MSSGALGIALALAMGLLLLPLPGAAAPALGVEATRLDLHDGALTARLSGAAFESGGCAGLSITGTAAHIHLEVDKGHTDYGVQRVAPVPPGEQPGRDTFDYEDAVLALSDPRPACRVVAWTDPGMQADVAFPHGAASLDPAPSVPTTYSNHPPVERPTFSVGGPDLVRATSPPGLAEATGSLRLSAWEATLDIRARNGSYHAVLGFFETPAPVVPGAPVPLVIQSDEAEAFVWLDGAHLAWTLPAGARVVATQAHVDAPSGSADLRDAVLASRASRVPSTLTLKSLRGDVSVQGTRLVGAFDAASAVAADGTAVALGGPGGLGWLPAAGIVVLASAAGGRRWALHGMRRAMDSDHCGRAAGLALAVWPPNAESRVARVVCLLRLGRFDAAAHALRSRPWRSQPATRSFLLARLEATRGDPAAARRHLAECFLLAPAFVTDARADQALNGIVEAALSRGTEPHVHREGYA